MAAGGLNKWTPPQKPEEILCVSTRLSFYKEQVDVGRDDRIGLARSNSQARTGTGKNVDFHCPADHEQDWQPYTVDPYSALRDYRSSCMVTHIARIWINRVRLPVLHVVS